MFPPASEYQPAMQPHASVPTGYPNVPTGYPHAQSQPAYHGYPGGGDAVHHGGYPATTHYPPPPAGYPTVPGASYHQAGNYGYPQNANLPPHVTHFQPPSGGPHFTANQCRTLGSLGGTYASLLGGEASTDTAVGFDASAESSGILGGS